MFNLTDLETPFFSCHAQFTDPAMFAAMEAEQDAQVVAHQLPTNQSINDTTCSLIGRIGHVNGVCVAYSSDGSPKNIG